jgi:hypothetical protein
VRVPCSWFSPSHCEAPQRGLDATRHDGGPRQRKGDGRSGSPGGSPCLAGYEAPERRGHRHEVARPRPEATGCAVGFARSRLTMVWGGFCEGDKSSNPRAGRGQGRKEKCHGARLVPSSPQAGCSAALRPDGDRAAFRGVAEGVGTKGVPARFRRLPLRQGFGGQGCARRTKGRGLRKRQGWKPEGPKPRLWVRFTTARRAETPLRLRAANP